MKANEPSQVTPPRRAAAGPVALVLAGVLLAAGGAVAPVVAQTADDFVQRGDTAWRAGRFAEAKSAYQRAVELAPSGASRAVYRLAVLLSWDGDLSGAIAGFQRYLVLEPTDDEGRIALGRAYAWAGRTDAAVAVYDSVLARDPTYRDAALGAAQTLAWAGRFRQSLARYDRWLADRGPDVAAALARARTLAWAGRLGESEAAYGRIVAAGEVLEGSKGVAVVAAWRGDLFRSEGLWRTITADFPTDAEAWVGLAQVLRWSGRPEEAGEALDRAVAIDPNNADGRAQRRWVRADLAPSAAPLTSYGWDSDGNRIAFGQLRAAWRPRRRVVTTATGSVRHAELDSQRGRSVGGRLGLSFLADRRLTLSAETGLVATRGERGTEVVERTLAIGSAQASVTVAPRLTVGAGVSRDVFDETAPLILSAIDVSTVNAEGRLELGSGVSLSAGGHRAWIRGGTVPNERAAEFATVRWRAHRLVVAGLAGRVIGYQASPRDGYFAPERYRHGELFARLEPRRDLGWSGYLEMGLGRQYVRFDGPGDGKGTQRLGFGLINRPTPGSEVALDYGFSNVAASGAIGVASGSIYRYQAVTLRGRLRL